MESSNISDPENEANPSETDWGVLMEEFDSKNYKLSDILCEDGEVYTHKFSEEQLQKLCLNFKCTVNLSSGNILYRLEKLQAHRASCPKIVKKQPKFKRLNLVKTIEYYKKHPVNANKQQSEREVELESFKLDTWLRNRMHQLKYFNIDYMNEDPIFESQTDTPQNISEGIEVAQTPEEEPTQNPSPFEFSYDLTESSSDETTDEPTPSVNKNSQRCTPLTYSQFNLNEIVCTSTQTTEKITEIDVESV